ncbi:MAG: succinate dehydrogenase cytochrome b subunit [Bacteroidales bacterium]|nr:succinate dehydrogenase cytochrome b subunit [Bacteroidales bacterium]
MSNLFSSSIGRKLIMSISGLFLILFICVHLSVNLLLIFDDSGKLFNLAAHFMDSNPIIKIVEPLLAIGFAVHLVYATIITIQNKKKRPQNYSIQNNKATSSWPSRNMFILGALIVLFLAVHLSDYFYKIKFGTMPTIKIDGIIMNDAYLVVSKSFINHFWYSLLYIASGMFLGLHLTHGFWSAFQTIGWTNDLWLKRLKKISIVYAIIVATGFSIIPLYFLIFM